MYKKSEIKQSMGRRIARRRKQLGMSTEELSKKIKLSPSYIQAVEEGRRFLPHKKLIALIHALETSPDALFRDFLSHPSKGQNEIFDQIRSFPLQTQQEILDAMEQLIQQEQRSRRKQP